MGEIADMMLEGLLDSETGEYIGDINENIFGDKAPGFPVSYENDSESNPKNYLNNPANRTPKNIKCTECNKRFAEESYMLQHRRDKHGIT